MAILTQARTTFHKALVANHTLAVVDGVASNADGDQELSIAIAKHIAERLAAQPVAARLSGQTAGSRFEVAVKDFVEQSFPLFNTLRPGRWRVERVGTRRGNRKRPEYQIAKYEPYSHLRELSDVIDENVTLAAVLGNSYEIGPDILVLREPEPDDVINGGHETKLVDDTSGRYSPIRQFNQTREIIHALVSCKWTLRSDRAQNARSEALNIIRNRKGRTPHIAVVTAEPTPSRLSSLALGTGDMDTVYHFALPELIEAVELTGNDEAISMLHILVGGKRLRDITDLPLDLTV